MKKVKNIVKKIMKYCPYDWAKNEKNVERSLGYWLNEDDMWKEAIPGDKKGWETGGFVFLKTKSGRRYIETLPIRIYID